MKAAIFDLDGTLIDSMYIYDTAYHNVVRALGYEPCENLRPQTRSLSGTEVIVFLKEAHGMSETVEEIEAALDEQLFGFYSTTPPLKPGVLEFLSHLEAQGVPMCVATATKRLHVEAALSRLGIARFFKRIFTCQEEQTGKSKPKIFLTAAEFLGTEPCDTCVFEDAHHAIETAKMAGFRVVGIEDESALQWRDEIRATADEYYADFTEVLW